MRSRRGRIASLVLCGIAASQLGSGRVQEPPRAATPERSPAAAGEIKSNREINDQYVRELREKIAGRENEPAEKVFKNIQIPFFKSVPAGRLLGIMNGGYSRALGVACTHCHVVQDFSSDDKRPKRAAREMAAMHRAINEQLGKMQNLETKPEERFINCTTCHRGAINPNATNP
jgi:hypothetical protein